MKEILVTKVTTKNKMEEKNRMDLRKWVTQEKAAMQKKREQQFKDKGIELTPFLKLVEGENKITLLPKIPRISEGQFGKQYIFQAKQGRTEYSLGIRENSPLYRMLVNVLTDIPTDLTIIRAGEQKATRYSIKKQ